MQLAHSDQEKSKEALISELTELRKIVPKLEKLTEEHKKGEKLQAALYAIADLATSAEDMDFFYSSLHHIIGNLMYANNFYISFYDNEAEILTFPYFVDSVDQSRPHMLPLEKVKRGLTAYVLRTGQGLLAPRDCIDDLVQKGEIDYVGEPPVYWLGVPLVRNNLITGAIVVQSYTEEISFTPRDKELLTFVSQHISTALERKQTLDELERRVQARTRELSEINEHLQAEISERKRAEKLKDALLRIAELTNTTSRMGEFYKAIHQIVGGLIYAQNFYIALLIDENTLSFPYSIDEFDKRPTRRELGRGLTEYVLRNGKPALLDMAKIHQLSEDQEIIDVRGTPPVHWLGVPLIYSKKQFGMLAVQSYKEEQRFRPGDQELLTFVSHHIATALERKRANDALAKAKEQLEQRVLDRTAELFEANRVLEHQIEERKRIEQRLIHDALHDALTGLPNRNLFMDRLVQAMKRMARNSDFLFAVLFLDLDRFKIINDSLGHMVGDELLKDVSNRVQSCMRNSDTVARLGGDEFAILMESIKGKEEAEAIATRIKAQLEKPFNLANRQVFTSTSIGIAVGNGRYTNPEDLLRDADAAMYRAKEGGRDRFEVFDESMHREAMAMLELENDLRRAVERDEFIVYYQPVVDLKTHRIAGFEALARWQHPRRGMVLPADFIPMAEETDLIMALDWRIIHKASRQLAEWQETFPEIRPMTLSVNVSSKHFGRPDFVDNLAVVLRSAALAGQHLKLEVRESALLENLASLNSILDNLSELGVQLLLDDFGTRYSSLSNLHRFPMETLKIDRTFVTNMLEVQENLEIVRTIKALASSLGMTVVAEGIETEDVCKKISELGCELIQGYYISRPLSSTRATMLLAQGGLLELSI